VVLARAATRSRVKRTAQNILIFMSVPPDHSARRLDPVAVQASLRRLASATQPPWLHGEVARRMAEKLQVILLKPELILDWWSFLGAGAGLLEQAYPKAHRVLVEPDAGWVERSRDLARRPWWSAGHWTGAGVSVVADSDEIATGAGLIWANMMLHAVVDPNALIERWQRLLRFDGFVMFSCLGPGTLRELRALYQRLGWPAPTPGFVDMHDLGDMLVQAGFADPVMDQETLTLRWNSPRALLAELRLLGGNTAPDRMTGLRTPRWRAQLERGLESLAAPDGSLGMTFEVAYGHAFKAAPRLRQSEPTTVSLDDMRAMVRASHGRSKA
jgi:malonyl-CoA O-methyltransferase